jgi:hypothetical protein
LKTSKEFQKLIVELCRSKKCNLGADGAYIKLTLDPAHYPLIIKRLTEWTVSVRHEFIADSGEVTPNPEVVFFTGLTEWVAIEINGPESNAVWPGQIKSSVKVAELNSSGKYIKSVEFDDQKKLATYVKAWHDVLKADGWDDFASDAAFKQARLDDAVGQQEPEQDDSHWLEGEIIGARQLPAGSAILVGGASE